LSNIVTFASQKQRRVVVPKIFEISKIKKMSAILKKVEIFLKKKLKKFGGTKNLQYLCTRLKVGTQLKSKTTIMPL